VTDAAAGGNAATLAKRMPVSGRRGATKRSDLSFERLHPLLKGLHPTAHGENLLDDHVLGLIDLALDLTEPAFGPLSVC
jgi:hypothetical protein